MFSAFQKLFRDQVLEFASFGVATLLTSSACAVKILNEKCSGRMVFLSTEAILRGDTLSPTSDQCQFEGIRTGPRFLKASYG